MAMVNMSKKFLTIIRHFESLTATIDISGTPNTAFYLRQWMKGVMSSYAADIAGTDEDHPINKRPGCCPSSNLGWALSFIASGKAAVGTTNSGKHVAELVCDDGSVQFAIFDPKKGAFKACILPEGEESPERYKLSDSNPVTESGASNKPKDGHYGTVIVLSMLPEFLKDKEFKGGYDSIINTLTTAIQEEKSLTKDDAQELSRLLAIISDNAELRMGYKELRTTVFVDYDNLMSVEREIPLLKIPDIQSGGRYHPTTTNIGKFNILTVDTAPEEAETTNGNSIWDKYTLTDEYKNSAFLPVINQETTLVPDYVETICKHVVASKKFRNFGMRGTAGSGKSMSAKIMAAMLHIPHYVFTCSANTEISDFQGQIIPILKKNADDNSVGYTYAESPLLKAVRDGGVLEIQEPNVIVQPGVIVGLNGIMEPDGILVLPTGEVVKRHPNTIVVITTNTTYEGCRDMNVSLLDRLDLVFDVNNPSVEELADRCKAQTGFKDDVMLREMAQIVTDISAAMSKENIEDGTAGLRSLINWAESTMITNDPYTSGMNCLISKTSANKEDRDVLAKYLGSASFAKRNRARKI